MYPQNYQATQNNNSPLSPEIDQENQQIKDYEQQLRLGFIRKVYGILCMQLLYTVFMCSLTFISSVNLFYRTHIVIFFICLVFSIVFIILLVCFNDLSKRVPNNYILLGLFTFCEVYMIATCSSFYSPKIVITAATMTTAVTLGLTYYACTTKTDFTFLGGFLFCATILLICLFVFSFFIPFLHTLMCVLGVLIFSLYLIFDTQLIMGKFGESYQIDDYIIAALMVYLDIITIFIYLLSLIGGR